MLEAPKSTSTRGAPCFRAGSPRKKLSVRLAFATLLGARGLPEPPSHFSLSAGQKGEFYVLVSLLRRVVGKRADVCCGPLGRCQGAVRQASLKQAAPQASGGSPPAGRSGGRAQFVGGNAARCRRTQDPEDARGPHDHRVRRNAP